MGKNTQHDWALKMFLGQEPPGVLFTFRWSCFISLAQLNGAPSGHSFYGIFQEVTGFQAVDVGNKRLGDGKNDELTEGFLRDLRFLDHVRASTGWIQKSIGE